MKKAKVKGLKWYEKRNLNYDQWSKLNPEQKKKYIKGVLFRMFLFEEGNYKVTTWSTIKGQWQDVASPHKYLTEVHGITDLFKVIKKTGQGKKKKLNPVREMIENTPTKTLYQDYSKLLEKDKQLYLKGLRALLKNKGAVLQLLSDDVEPTWEKSCFKVPRNTRRIYRLVPEAKVKETPKVVCQAPDSPKPLPDNLGSNSIAGSAEDVGQYDYWLRLPKADKEKCYLNTLQDYSLDTAYIYRWIPERRAWERSVAPRDCYDYRYKVVPKAPSAVPESKGSCVPFYVEGEQINYNSWQTLSDSQRTTYFQHIVSGRDEEKYNLEFWNRYPGKWKTSNYSAHTIIRHDHDLTTFYRVVEKEKEVTTYENWQNLTEKQKRGYFAALLLDMDRNKEHLEFWYPEGSRWVTAINGVVGIKSRKSQLRIFYRVVKKEKEVTTYEEWSKLSKEERISFYDNMVKGYDEEKEHIEFWSAGSSKGVRDLAIDGKITSGEKTMYFHRRVTTSVLPSLNSQKGTCGGSKLPPQNLPVFNTGIMQGDGIEKIEEEKVVMERGKKYGDAAINMPAATQIVRAMISQAMQIPLKEVNEKIPDNFYSMIQVAANKILRECYAHDEDNGVDCHNYLQFARDDGRKQAEELQKENN